MTDQENFLARWSRRKRESAADVPPSNKPLSPERPNDPAGSAVPQPPATSAAPAPEFDISQLPSIDSIGPDTDITAFMQSGVPSALRAAALRRAWSADPAIRDFVEINENYWEAVAPGAAVPGFGPLGPQDDVQRLVREVFREAESDPDERQGTSQSATAADQTHVAARNDAGSTMIPPGDGAVPMPTSQEASAELNSAPQRNNDVALQHDDSSQRERLHRHGSALPQ